MLTKISRHISRTAGPNLGMFVLILIHFTCRLQIWLQNSTIFWNIFLFFNSPNANLCCIDKKELGYVDKNIKYIKNRWTKYRHVCTRFDPFHMLTSNIITKFNTFFSWKKIGKVLPARTRQHYSTSVKRLLIYSHHHPLIDVLTYFRACWFRHFRRQILTAESRLHILFTIMISKLIIGFPLKYKKKILLFFFSSLSLSRWQNCVGSPQRKVHLRDPTMMMRVFNNSWRKKIPDLNQAGMLAGTRGEIVRTVVEI